MYKSPKFTSDEEKEICQKYIDGLSTIFLAKEYNCKYDSTINKILIKNGIPRRDRSNQRRIYNINENYFDVIDSEYKSYFLGFLFADGGNVGNSIFLSLKSSDKDVLKTLNGLIESDKPIRKYFNSFGHESSRLEISNKYMVEKLNLLGVCKNKTFKIRFPNIDQKLFRHFIRGYFDGDGGFSKNNYNNWSYRITSNELFCKDLKEIISSEANVNVSILNIKNKISKRIQVSGNIQILRTCEWMYKESNIFLERKYQQYLQLKNNPHAKRYK